MKEGIQMKRKLGLAFGAIGLFLISAVPAAAAPPQFACVLKSTGDLLYPIDSAPGDDGWALDVRICTLKPGTRVSAIRG